MNRGMCILQTVRLQLATPSETACLSNTPDRARTHISIYCRHDDDNAVSACAYRVDRVLLKTGWWRGLLDVLLDRGSRKPLCTEHAKACRMQLHEMTMRCDTAVLRRVHIAYCSIQSVDRLYLHATVSTSGPSARITLCRAEIIG